MSSVRIPVELCKNTFLAYRHLLKVIFMYCIFPLFFFKIRNWRLHHVPCSSLQCEMTWIDWWVKRQPSDFFVHSTTRRQKKTLALNFPKNPFFFFSWLFQVHPTFFFFFNYIQDHRNNACLFSFRGLEVDLIRSSTSRRNPSETPRRCFTELFTSFSIQTPQLLLILWCVPIFIHRRSPCVTF